MKDATDKISLVGRTLEEFQQLNASLNLPNYRTDQLFNWIYKKKIKSFDEMTNFSKLLRKTFSEKYEINLLKLLNEVKSEDNTTIKFLFQLNDGLCVESVFMIEGKRTTICLSSQVGCSLKCDFCATGKMGFKRNLATGEIVDQLLYIQRHLNTEVTNVVFMGMGEPFLNYDNVIKACHIISHEKGMAIGKRKITISTSGIIPAITRFADEGFKYQLAISLNSVDNDIRSKLMPINKKYPVGELINAARYYSKKNRNRITFEFVLIKGVNDSIESALKLKKLIHNFPCKINLIPYNPTDDKYSIPSEESIDNFIKPFINMNVIISVRRSKGEKIDAACGQLYYNYSKLSEQSFNATPGMPNT